MDRRSQAVRADRLRRGLITAVGSLTALAITGAARAQSDSSVRTAAEAIPGPVGSALAQPRLAGAGRLRWFGLAIYDARLFVPAEGMDPARYARAPFALELQYARSLAGDDIAQASHKEMTRMQFGTPDQRAGWLASMRRLFPDVSAGDRLTGINRPDGLVQFYRNDTALGRVDDPRFGEAFFAIWLDPRTQAPDLRRALLQGLSPGRPS